LKLRFTDFFAGIGGFRVALQQLGGQCVFTSEWDRFARRTYEAWHGDLPHGDIRDIDAAAIPDHDLLCAGFPCQPFSIAGVSKKNSLGRAHGFDDKHQGNLFFELTRIIAAKQPPLLLLENVKNLRSHDQGNTWRVIARELDALGYHVFADVVDARHWVPQHRERIYIAAFHRQRWSHTPPFQFPSPASATPTLRSILDPTPDARYNLSPHLWKYLRDYAARHKAAGNGFGYGLPSLDGVSRTLSARYHKDGSEILIAREPRQTPRRLTPAECARLMGFHGYEGRIVVSDTQAYRQFGNAVVPPVVKAIAAAMLRAVSWR
jgi:DNA (cytosine-5)-methyltransferase 1